MKPSIGGGVGGGGGGQDMSAETVQNERTFISVDHVKVSPRFGFIGFMKPVMVINFRNSGLLSDR